MGPKSGTLAASTGALGYAADLQFEEAAGDRRIEEMPKMWPGNDGRPGSIP